MSIKPDHIQLGFLKALYGTSLRERADEYSLVFEPFPPYEILQNKWLSADDLRLLRRIEQLVETLLNSHILDLMLSALAAQHGSWFSFLTEISVFCENTNFDILTKNNQKIETMIHQFSSK